MEAVVGQEGENPMDISQDVTVDTAVVEENSMEVSQDIAVDHAVMDENPMDISQDVTVGSTVVEEKPIGVSQDISVDREGAEEQPVEVSQDVAVDQTVTEELPMEISQTNHVDVVASENVDTCAVEPVLNMEGEVEAPNVSDDALNERVSEETAENICEEDRVDPTLIIIGTSVNVESHARVVYALEKHAETKKIEEEKRVASVAPPAPSTSVNTMPPLPPAAADNVTKKHAESVSQQHNSIEENAEVEVEPPMIVPELMSSEEPDLKMSLWKTLRKQQKLPQQSFEVRRNE